MKRLRFLMMFTMVTGLLMTACYPDHDVFIEDLDIAISSHNEEVDFSQLSSFYMKDTVIHVLGDDILPDRSYDNHIVSEIRQHFLDAGWTEITDTINMSETVDVVLHAAVLDTDIYSYYYSWYDYYFWYPWDWFYYSYDPYYSYYYYPSYYSGYSVYNYTTGTILIEMINTDGIIAEDPEDGKIDIKIPIVWSAGINGILAGSESSIMDRISVQMDQLFEQSPYLLK